MKSAGVAEDPKVSLFSAYPPSLRILWQEGGG
jgi:hypothetical protein